MITVGERMSTDISPVRPDTTLIEAAQRMRISGVGGIPVLGHNGEECAGILTERDIVIRVLAEEREARAVIVRDVATLHPVTCSPEEDIEAVAARMRAHQVQHLPVCRAGRSSACSRLPTSSSDGRMRSGHDRNAAGDEQVALRLLGRVTRGTASTGGLSSSA